MRMTGKKEDPPEITIPPTEAIVQWLTANWFSVALLFLMVILIIVAVWIGRKKSESPQRRYLYY